MTPASLRHEAISASAGSGKTFQLAHRYIRLLAAGVEPDRIAALTFSRKAAGEIFDEIVKYLCEAAGSSIASTITSERIGSPAIEQDQFVLMLKKLVRGLHRLHIGTLDSFTVGILRSFPFELGIPPGISLMESGGADALKVQERVLSSLYLAGARTADSSDALLKALAQASFGRSEKKVQENLTALVSAYHTYYRLLPDRDAWGSETVVWPDGSEWLSPAKDARTAADRLERLLTESGARDKAAARFRAFAAAASSYTARSAWSDPLKYLFPRLLGATDDLRAGRATIMTDGIKTVLDGEAAECVLALVGNVVRAHLESARHRTAGAYSLLDRYDTEYERLIRESGTLTFEDAQFLLSGANRSSGGARLSRLRGEAGRLYVDYRLDARLDHWLLDEFQDTSDLQWEVLSNLVDEILQDDTGQRSFFYVGDVKQAIYGWRGGNPRLFGMLLDRYGEAIQTRELVESQRSCTPIVDMVNQVFGSLPDDRLPPTAIERWRRFWQPHRSAQGPALLSGHATLLEPLCDEGEYKPTPEDRYRIVAGLLRDIEPLSRGLSVAVLVRSNKDGKAVVDHLRSACPGLPVVHEGRAAIEDNPVVSLMLSLVKYAAHPGDTFAWRHVQMSPLRHALRERHLTRDTLGPELLRGIHAEGFRGLIIEWGVVLDTAGGLDAFGRTRLRQLLTAAGEFDSTGSRDCDGFLAFIDKYELHELAADDAVRVMTIHQSKGLGFDVVILPELDDRTMAKAREVPVLLGRDERSLPRWLLTNPAHGVAEGDPTLAAALADANAGASFESLCLLYVAMTRAKRGLYVITSYQGKASQVFHQPAFLKLQLTGEEKPTGGRIVHIDGSPACCLSSHGDALWYASCPSSRRPEESPPFRALDRSFAERPSQRGRLVAIRPSDNDRFESSASALFSPDRRLGLDVGTAVHELFSRVKWLDEADVAAIEGEWASKSDVDERTREMALQHFRKAVGMDAIQNALRKPAANVEARTEWRFDVVVGERWLTGSFDRVAVERDTSGQPVRATIYDFKTDAVESRDALQTLVQPYSRQLLLYRDALSAILRLPPARIRLLLVFTGPGVTHEVTR
jgi:ATP-dependent helicase/nuclease subunit A